MVSISANQYIMMHQLVHYLIRRKNSLFGHRWKVSGKLVPAFILLNRRQMVTVLTWLHSAYNFSSGRKRTALWQQLLLWLLCQIGIQSLQQLHIPAAKTGGNGEDWGKNKQTKKQLNNSCEIIPRLDTVCSQVTTTPVVTLLDTCWVRKCALQLWGCVIFRDCKTDFKVISKGNKVQLIFLTDQLIFFLFFGN